MNVHGYELTSEWRNSTSGQIAEARKDGRKYFLKKYQTPVAPLRNGALDDKTFAHNQRLFKRFVDYRTLINNTIRPLAGLGGNIVIPCDEFVFGNNYVEASEYVENTIPEEEYDGVLQSLSPDVKKLLMQTAAGALASVHSKGIVHSDLKPKNVMIVRNKTGNYVAKLVDFDSSYFVADKYEELIGTIDYYSPEFGRYVDAEDDREEMGRCLTEKSDIFSLGLIFHYYLSGCLPTPTSLTERLRRRKAKGRVIYCWVALNCGCKLELSRKITNPKYISLISDMLSYDPSERPSATDVLKRLQAEPVIEEPWPEHHIILDKDNLSAFGIVGLSKVTISGTNAYSVLNNKGHGVTLDKDGLISRGLARIMAPSGFCDPWPEHEISFDLDRIKSRGFTSSEQSVLSGVKGYNFYRADSTVTFFKREMLLAMKYAKKTPTAAVVLEAEVSSPWPEHKIMFNIDQIKRKGFTKIERDALGGVNGYTLTRSDGNKQFIRVEMAILQRLATRL